MLRSMQGLYKVKYFPKALKSICIIYRLSACTAASASVRLCSGTMLCFEFNTSEHTDSAEVLDNKCLPSWFSMLEC